MEPNNQQAWLSRNLRGLPHMANSTQIDDNASVISSRLEEAENLERRIELLKLETQRLEEQSRRTREEIIQNQRITEQMDILRRNYATSVLPKPGTTAAPAYPLQFPVTSAHTFQAPAFHAGGQTYRFQGIRSFSRRRIACNSTTSHNSCSLRFNQPNLLIIYRNDVLIQEKA